MFQKQVVEDPKMWEARLGVGNLKSQKNKLEQDRN